MRKENEMTDTSAFALGWLPDYPDLRDFTPETDQIRGVFEKAKSRVVRPPKALPANVDLRAWCPPVENQGSIGSCTAQAGVGLVEYYERRAFGKHLDASRLFLYKTTRNLLHWTGDTGAFLRTTMKAMVLFGVPPEEYWPYHPGDFDDEPTAFCYAFAQSYQTIQYYRFDPPGVSASELLNRIKTYLSSGYASMFGFTVYDSISEAADNEGKIPFPKPGDRVIGGHAVDAVGYDDQMKIGDITGAFLIRNSWGTGWGDDGYGWLPYAYVEEGLAIDWWTVLKQEWIDTKAFD
jgi:C1A family cysteine protease